MPLLCDVCGCPIRDLDDKSQTQERYPLSAENASSGWVHSSPVLGCIPAQGREIRELWEIVEEP